MQNNELFKDLQLLVNMVGRKKEVKQQKTCKKCIGFSISEFKMYYAVSGLDEYDDDYEKFFSSIQFAVEDILGKIISSPQRCNIASSIFSFSNTYKEVEGDEKEIYDTLLNNLGRNNIIHFKHTYNAKKHEKFSESIIIRNEDGKIKLSPEYRKWSCVERKIVGKTNSKNHSIFCSKKPCYFCIPEITNVYFFNGLQNQKYYMNIKDINTNSICEILMDKIEQ